MNRKWLLIASAAVLLSACSEQASETESEADTDPAPTTEEPLVMTADERPEQMRTDALGEQIERARNDLAERLDIVAMDIEVEKAEFVTWNDGALGCPEPDMAYTQALVPGYRILLLADGQTYHYHGSRDREPFYCPAERAGKPLPADDLM